MGLLTEAFMTVVELTRKVDGRIYDTETNNWLPATTESLASADDTIKEVISAMTDMVPFPIQANVLGIIQLDISRSQMDVMLDKVRATVRNYALITTKKA